MLNNSEMSGKLLGVLYRLDAKTLNAIPDETFDLICNKMQAQIAAERPKWLRWQQKLQSGGHSRNECKKKKKQPKMPKSQLSDAERAALAAGWVKYDAEKAALQAQ